MKKLFVGGLPWSFTDEQLAELFAPYGEVISAKIATERGTGRSRGFGFVEMEDEAAEAAKAALDGQEAGGRSIKVDFANPLAPREDRGPRSSFDNRRSGGNYGRPGGSRSGGGRGPSRYNDGGNDYSGSTYTAQ